MLLTRVSRTRWSLRFFCAALVLFAVASELGEGLTIARPAARPDQYGIDKNRYQQMTDTVHPDQTLDSILRKYGVSSEALSQLEERAKPVFDVRDLRAGNELFYYIDVQTHSIPLFVYRRDLIRYVVFDFRDSVFVDAGALEPVTVRKEARNVIRRTLFDAVEDIRVNAEVAQQLTNIFQWQISFDRLTDRDEFSVVYEEGFIDGVSVSHKVLSARLNHNGQDFYAYRHPQDDGSFYNEKGESLTGQFLQAPVKYTRISSSFNNHNRFHPVLRTRRPHLGTDFAAPAGTPIRATADGVVVAATYARNNGRYVRIRHNETYETAYLHMSRIAVERGQHVLQGETIGYVGSTGLATGPHVCYRLWKNGEPIDPEEFGKNQPPSESIGPADIPAFDQLRAELASRLKLKTELRFLPAGMAR